MKKKWMVLIVVAVMIVGSLMEVSAKAGENTKNPSNLKTEKNIETEDENEDRAIVRYAINGSVLEPGNIKYYYPSGDSAGFNVKENVSVTVSLSLNKTVTLRVFLTNGSSSIIYGNEPGAVVYPDASRKMRLGIENMSSESVTVNGTITW